MHHMQMEGSLYYGPLWGRQDFSNALMVSLDTKSTDRAGLFMPCMI